MEGGSVAAKKNYSGCIMTTIVRTVVTLLLLFHLPPLQAFTCYEKSQDLIRLGDDYYDMDNPVELTDKTRKNLKTLYKRLTGEWTGHIEEIDCKGPESAPRQELKAHTASTTITPGLSDSLKLRFEKYSKEENVTRNELLELVSPDIIFDIQASKNSIRLQEKYRISSADNFIRDFDPTDRRRLKRGPIFYERLIDLKTARNTLSITIRYFINGHAASEQRIRLKKS
ncbi:MAG: hypothetical protein ACR2PT_12325 [Endozoicomonas sp.]